MNAVKINGINSAPIENFVKLCLFETSKVAYDKITGVWALGYGEGVNKLGNPVQITFVFRNGKSYVRPASYDDNPYGAYLINAMPYTYSLSRVIEETTQFLDQCKIAINQNVRATKTPFIIVSKNKDLQLSLEHAIQDQQDGKPVMVVSEDLGETLKSVQLNVPYVADKIEEIAGQWENKLLNKLGTMSANIEKRERVQVGEVNATVGQCSDYLYILIDNFNKQMETYGLPFTMEINNSLEELYEEDAVEQEEQPQESEVENNG